MKPEFTRKHQNLFLFLIFIGIYLSFSIEIIKQPFIISEDAIFLNDALKDGIGSLFNRHAQYLEIISRLTGIVSIYIGKITNSYWMATFGMRFISIVLGAYFVFYFTLEDFSWILKKKSERFLVSVLMLVWMGNFYNMLYNIPCIHWYGELFGFWIGLNLIHGRFPKIRDCILYILVCLNSPEGCITVLPMCIYLIYNLKQRKKVRFYETVTVGCGIASCLIQLYCLRQGGTTDITGGLFSWKILKHTIASSVQCSTLVFGNAFVKLLPLFIQIVLGLLIWFALLYFLHRSKYGRLIFLYLSAFIFIHYFMIMVKGTWNWFLVLDMETWINAMPATAFSAIVFCLVMNRMRVRRQSALSCILVVVLMICCLSQINDVGKIGIIEGDHYKTEPYDYTMLGMDGLIEIEDRVDFSSDKYEYLSIYGACKIMIPVSEDTTD